MKAKVALIVIAAVLASGCQGARYVPSDLKGTPIEGLASIMPVKGGVFHGPDYRLSSVDGVKIASGLDGGSPKVYLSPGSHEFVIGEKYIHRDYYNKGARVGSGVVTSSGYSTFATEKWEPRSGELNLEPGREYTVEEVFDELSAGEGALLPNS